MSLPKPSFAEQLLRYVRPDVIHNGKAVGVDGYVSAIEGVLKDYPAGVDHIPTLVVDDEHQMVAARVVLLPDDATAARGVLPLMEHVFYQFVDGKIKEVWSMVSSQE